MRELRRRSRSRPANGLRPLWLVTLALALLLPRPAGAQAASAEVQHRKTWWLGVMTDWRLTGPWSFWLDGHYNNQAFAVLRAGITYDVGAGLRLTAGYARAWAQPGHFERDEHRAWAQAFFPFRLSERWRLSQRLRTELRFRERVQAGEVVPGWIEVVRLRSQTALTVWLASPDEGWFLQPAIEILADVAGDAGPNYLDQNRVSLMLGYAAGPVTVRAGYMLRFVPGTTGVAPVAEHDAVLWLNYTFERRPPPVEPARRGHAPAFGSP